MIVYTHRIYYDYNKPVYLKPIFDVHFGATACDERAFKSFLEDSDENTYFIGGGDLIEGIVPTDIRYRKSSDSTYGDPIIDEQVARIVELLSPYKKKIIGIGTGNHEDNATKKYGSNPAKRIADGLGAAYLGYYGLIRLQLADKRYKDKFSRGRTIIIRYHHGWGGGSRTQGASITKYSKDMAYWDADLFLYGHDHRKQTDTVPRLGLVGNKLISKPKVLCICGTYLKTYGNSNDPTYSGKAGYPPVEIGGVVAQIKVDKNHYRIKAYLD